MKYNGKEIVILNPDKYFRGSVGVEFRTKDGSDIPGAQSLGKQTSKEYGTYETYFAERKDLTEGVLDKKGPVTVKDADAAEVQGYVEKVKKALKRNPGVTAGAIAGLAIGIVNAMGLGYKIHPQDLPDPVLFTAIATAGTTTIGGIVQAIKNRMAKPLRENFIDTVREELNIVEDFNYKEGQRVKFRLRTGSAYRSNHVLEGKTGVIVRKTISNRADRGEFLDVLFDGEKKPTQVDSKNLIRA